MNRIDTECDILHHQAIQRSNSVLAGQVIAVNR